MAKIILQSLWQLQPEFKQNPFDFLSSEMEAQVRLYCALRQHKHIQGTFRLSDDENDDPAVPRMDNLPTARLKLEWAVKSGGTRRHDIAVLEKDSESVFKKNTINPEGYDKVEAFIEVKTGWGVRKGPKGILEGDGTQNDFEKLNACKSKGYLVIFVGNKWKKMENLPPKKANQGYYLERLQKEKERCGFCDGHVYVVFRDGILTGEGDFLPEKARL